MAIKKYLLSYVLKLSPTIPSEWTTVPPNSKDIPGGFAIVKCDAGYKDGPTGICVSIEIKGRQYKDHIVKGHSEGPVHAELRAILSALRKVNSIRAPLQYCIIYTDCRYAYFFANNHWIPKRNYIQDVVKDIQTENNKLVRKGIHVHLFNTAAKHVRRIDGRAKTARKEQELKKKAQIAVRERKIRETIERSHEIEIIIIDEVPHARSSDGHSIYVVAIDPPSCECQGWVKNWSDKHIRAILARALPCKHMCALCKYLGLDVSVVFKRQIERMD